MSVKAVSPNVKTRRPRTSTLESTMLTPPETENMASHRACPVCHEPVGPNTGVYRVCGTDYHPACYEHHYRESLAVRDAEPATTLVSEWAKFIAPADDGTPHARPAHDALATDTGLGAFESDLFVTLEVWLDVKDIALQDTAELAELKRTLAGVDREMSVGSWPAAEPPAVRQWRADLVRRAWQSDVAAAILHALAPYHALMRRADPGQPVTVAHVPTRRVVAIRRVAVMTAWFEQMREIAARDPIERSAWMRYWITIGSRTGTRQDSAEWQREVQARAERGSAVAARIVEAVRRRDQAMAALDRVVDHAVVALDVPGIG